MHISDLLIYKLEQDLLDDLSNYYKINNLNMNLKFYNKFIKKKIKIKIKNISFLNSRDNFVPKDSNNRCCARIWDNHYGTRCKYKKIKNKDYCKHHQNTIDKNGKLLFNRYDEERPLLNDKNNPIPWENDSKMEILNDILQKQWYNTEKFIKHNLHKQRQITP